MRPKVQAKAKFEAEAKAKYSRTRLKAKLSYYQPNLLVGATNAPVIS